MTFTNSSTRLVAVAAGIAVALVLTLGASMPVRAAALTQTQIQSILGLLTSFGADQATLNNVSAALNGQPTTGGTTGGTTTGGTTSTGSLCPFTWSRNLQVGSTGADVKALQQFLNMNAATRVAASGAGSPGMESMTFGPATRAAVMKFQTANGISPLGNVGPMTRAKLNSLCTGTGTPTTPGTPAGTSGTGLRVMLAATSPMNSVLVSGQAIGNIGEFTFMNPSSAPITVTGVTFNRIGVSNDQTINNVYLYNGVTRLTDSAGVSNSQFSFTNAAGLFTVPAGASVTISVRADISSSNTSGQQIGVSLVNVAASGSLNSSTVFPIMSGFQTISAANLATVDFNSTTLPSADTTVSPQSDYPVWQNTISVATNPVVLRSMRFTNLGSIDAAALTNLRLYVGGTQVGSAVPMLGADRSVTFDLSANPVTLSTQSHVVKVLGNIVGGASRTIQFSLQRSSDAMLVDTQLNQPILPTKNGSAFSAVTSGGKITVNAVSGTSGVSVTKAQGSPTEDISVGASNVKFASFDFLASGEAVKVTDLYVYADTSIRNGGLKNGKIFANGVQVGSTKDIGEGSSNRVTFNLGSSLILPPGTPVRVDIYADAKTSTSTNLVSTETVVVSIYGASSLANAQGQSSLQSADVPSASQSGNTITVTSASLTATKASGYSNQTMVAGTTGAKIGSFTLAAGSTEAINVNTLGIELSSVTGLTNLTLKDGNTVIGTAITSPSNSSANTFSVNLSIPVSGTKTIDVYADLLSNAATVTATLDSGTTNATGNVSGSSVTLSSDVTLQTITVGTGALFGANGTNNPVARNVIGGSSLQVGNFSFSGSNSTYTVKKLLVKIPNGVASAVSNVTISYKDANNNTLTATQALSTPTTEPYATATFTGLNFFVPSSGSADLNVSVATPAVDSQNGISGNAIKAYIDRVNGFQALDASGNATTTGFAASDLNSNNTSGYGLLVVRKSVPTFAGLSLNSTTAPTSGSDLFRFTITADAAGPVDVYKLSFNVSTTSSGITASNWSLYDVADTSTALNTAANPNSSGVLAITPTQVITVGAGQTKTFVLRASTISGWASGKSISTRFADVDSSAVANAAASSVSGSYVWSDRSAANHGTGTSDWTNGYLLKNLVDGVYNYSANF